jgi:hypothetical protein
MRRLIALVFVVGMMFGSHGTAADEKTPPAKQLQFTVRIFEGDPLGSPEEGTLKVLADTRLSTLENRPMFVLSGQEILVPDVTMPVQLGQKLEVLPGAVKDGRLCLDITMSTTTAGEKKNGRTQFHAQTTRTITTIKLGEVVKIRCGDRGADKQSWVELSVDQICGIVSRP